jgi:hypothetical protein
MPTSSPAKNSWLKTSAAASEYSWKSMNSSAVPSQPEMAARTRSPVDRLTVGGGAGASTSGMSEVLMNTPS